MRRRASLISLKVDTTVSSHYLDGESAPTMIIQLTNT